MPMLPNLTRLAHLSKRGPFQSTAGLEIIQLKRNYSREQVDMDPKIYGLFPAHGPPPRPRAVIPLQRASLRK